MINWGKRVAGRLTWGWWFLYGLGCERQDLPAYVVLADPGGLPVDGPNNWSSGFLPAVYQGTPFRAQARRSPTSPRRPTCPLRRGATSSICSTASTRPTSAGTRATPNSKRGWGTPNSPP